MMCEQSSTDEKLRVNRSVFSDLKGWPGMAVYGQGGHGKTGGSRYSGWWRQEDRDPWLVGAAGNDGPCVKRSSEGRERTGKLQGVG